MKTCPNDEELAALTNGDVSGRQARKLLEHIRDCDKCRAKARRFTSLAHLLATAKQYPDGTLVFQEPEPTPESDERLKKSVLHAFQEMRIRKGRTRALVSQALGDMLAGLRSTGHGLPLIGYASIESQESSLSGTEAVQMEDRLRESLTHILEILLDDEVLLAERVRWADAVSGHVKGFREKLKHAPSSRSPKSRRSRHSRPAS